MKKINYYFIGLVLLVSCVGLQDVSLTEPVPLQQFNELQNKSASKPLPVLEYRKGMFYSAGSDISKWVSSHDNLIVEKSGKSLVINMDAVGKNWEQLSIKFKPLDFSNAPNLLVRAKVDGLEIPKIRIDLGDIQGRYTSYYVQEKRIAPRTGYMDYSFVYSNRFVQSWPVRATVDSTQIVEIKLNINGGGPNFTGNIYIDAIRAVPYDSLF